MAIDGPCHVAMPEVKGMCSFIYLTFAVLFIGNGNVDRMCSFIHWGHVRVTPDADGLVDKQNIG